MQLVVDPRTYTGSVGYLLGASEQACTAAQGLFDGLATTGGMAGDDATSTAYAAAYDASAREVADALVALPCVTGVLGRALAVCRDHHLAAERANHAGLRGTSPGLATVPGSSVDDDSWPTTVRCGPPPSAAGPAPTDLPGWASVVLSHVQGFVWPDADVGRLHAAADLWRRTQAATWSVMPYVGRAAEALDELRSPEIPVAREHLDGLVDRTHRLSEACARLAEACDAYADEVTTQRTHILEMVRDLARDTAILEVVGGIADLVIGPEATAGATAAALARIAAESPAILRCLELLRAAGEAIAETLRPLAEYVDELRIGHLESLRIYGAERGSFALLPDGEQEAIDWIRLQEGTTGHVIDRHVARTDEQLLQRFRRQPSLRTSSTFNDAQTAQREMRKVMWLRRREIDTWLERAGPTDTKAFFARADPGIGRSLTRDGAAVPIGRVKMVIVPDTSAPRGYAVVTCHPGR